MFDQLEKSVTFNIFTDTCDGNEKFVDLFFFVFFSNKNVASAIHLNAWSTI